MATTVEVIFTKTVKGVSEFGKRKRVKLGYFSNFLERQGLAVLANDHNDAQFKAFEKKEAERLKDVKVAAEELKNSLEGKTVVLSASAQDTGRLYGSVTPSQIVDALKDQYNVTLDTRLVPPQPIKEVGKVSMQVEPHPEVTITFNVHVKSEGVDEDFAQAEEEEKAQAEEAARKAAEAKAAADANSTETDNNAEDAEASE